MNVINVIWLISCLYLGLLLVCHLCVTGNNNSKNSSITMSDITIGDFIWATLICISLKKNGFCFCMPCSIKRLVICKKVAQCSKIASLFISHHQCYC